MMKSKTFLARAQALAGRINQIRCSTKMKAEAYKTGIDYIVCVQGIHSPLFLELVRWDDTQYQYEVLKRMIEVIRHYERDVGH